MKSEVKTFDQFLQSTSAISEDTVKGVPIDDYGDLIGLSDKSESSFNNLNLPSDGPIGSLRNSAYANVNVPTRGYKPTVLKDGRLGCAAAVSLIFYRATGYAITDSSKLIELSTSKLWNTFSTSSNWKKISNWKSDYKPGDFIITARGSQAGHVGVVVDNGNIISNSSGGFAGDNPGQIEQNYTIKGWEKVAARNPDKTAIFRYVGPFRKKWGGPEMSRGEAQASKSDKSTPAKVKYGSTGTEVKRLQLSLLSAIPDSLPKYGADGKFKEETLSALKEFQKINKIKQTGVLDADTANALKKTNSYNNSDKKPASTKKFSKLVKIYDSENRKIVIARILSDGKIVIKSKSGEILGHAEKSNGNITLEYPLGTKSSPSESSSKSVDKSIFNILTSTQPQSKSNKSTVSSGSKLSPSDFIKTYGPAMIEATKGTPLLPSVKLAQAALETGWGEHVIGSANNMFGIKAAGSPNEYWDGSKVTAGTSEYYGGKRGSYQKSFRKYDSYKDSIMDHSRLLLKQPNYQGVRDATTPEDQARALAAGGYATSPTYADKLISIINKYNFKSLDQQAGK